MMNATLPNSTRLGMAKLEKTNSSTWMLTSRLFPPEMCLPQGAPFSVTVKYLQLSRTNILSASSAEQAQKNQRWPKAAITVMV